MVQRTHSVLTDDVDGSEAVETVVFALDGVPYEIDLSERNASALRQALSPYVEHARALTPRRRPADRPGTGVDSGAVRAWARENGVPVNSRGRVPAEVVEQYVAAGH